MTEEARQIIKTAITELRAINARENSKQKVKANQKTIWKLSQMLVEDELDKQQANG